MRTPFAQSFGVRLRAIAVALRRAATAGALPFLAAGAQGAVPPTAARTEAGVGERTLAASGGAAEGAVLTSVPRAGVLSVREVPTPAPRAAATSAVTVVPFGHAETVLTCSVLRACVIELEAGEHLVNEPLAGDQARWIIAHARTGPAGANALVVVKPKACNLTTNLVLSTDRRIYDLDLDSPPCSAYAGTGTNPKRAYERHIRFSYPEDSLAAVSRHTASVVADSAPAIEKGAAPAPPLNYEYVVVRGRHGPFGLFGEQPIDFPWVPGAMSDDGAHVYITLPAEARQHPAPVLYAVESDGSRTIVNYTMRDTVVITDRTFRRGLFVIAAGEREQRLEFENRAWDSTAETRRPE